MFLLKTVTQDYNLIADVVVLAEGWRMRVLFMHLIRVPGNFLKTLVISSNDGVSKIFRWW